MTPRDDDDQRRRYDDDPLTRIVVGGVKAGMLLDAPDDRPWQPQVPPERVYAHPAELCDNARHAVLCMTHRPVAYHPTEVIFGGRVFRTLRLSSHSTEQHDVFTVLALIDADAADVAAVEADPVAATEGPVVVERIREPGKGWRVVADLSADHRGLDFMRTSSKHDDHWVCLSDGQLYVWDALAHPALVEA